MGPAGCHRLGVQEYPLIRREPKQHHTVRRICRWSKCQLPGDGSFLVVLHITLNYSYKMTRSIHTLVLSQQTLTPHNKGMVKRAISQSGVALCPWAINKNPRKFAEEVCHGISIRSFIGIYFSTWLETRHEILSPGCCEGWLPH